LYARAPSLISVRDPGLVPKLALDAVTFAVAWLTSVILASTLIVTKGSRLASIKLRAYSDASRNNASARVSWVMSRAIEDAPMIAPSWS
jgi:hypothetical protein